MIIEKIKKEDAKELAHNIAVVWNTTYKGIVDNEFLEILYLNEDYSAKNIINKIDNNDNYYVLKLNNKIIGWIYYDYLLSCFNEDDIKRMNSVILHLINEILSGKEELNAIDVLSPDDVNKLSEIL